MSPLLNQIEQNFKQHINKVKHPTLVFNLYKRVVNQHYHPDKNIHSLCVAIDCSFEHLLKSHGLSGSIELYRTVRNQTIINWWNQN